MKKNKNIDELFKERFKNFEASPSPDVWNKIQIKLKEKDDRKVIPIWFKLGGIAALFALLFTIGNAILNVPLNKINDSIVNENSIEINTEKANNTIVNHNVIQNDIVLTEDNNEVKSTKKLLIKKASNSTNNSNGVNRSETKVASNNKKQRVSRKHSKQDLIQSSELIIKNQESVANETTNLIDKRENQLINKDVEIDKNIEVVAVNKITKDTPENPSSTEKKELVKEENKKSIFDAIKETSEEEVVIAKLDNTPDNRWEVTPNVAPVYYNSLTEGSSIDPSFSDNPKNGDLNIAYGVKVSYNLNKRLSMRSGLSNVNLSYSTTGLDIGTGPVSASTASIEYSSRNNVTIVVDKGALVNQNPDETFGNVTPKSTNGEPLLNQKISYYEMPLELNYTLINKNFGISVIGGFSALLLGNNEVSIEAGDFNEVLGEASNLSSLSFTTNVGLGLNYSLSKKLMFNIEPMFKYQLNPYTDSSVNFKPYYLGIYSGLSFKF
ncbi:MAG: hypothetical protein HOF75_05505 [Flavobacteriaceae bacterium]|jgi:hypothetical protein|nr:hypothetical protein [Flavobacteriaceae bacterium]MBT3920474.1 hypothetical protein [Flavobacteriaceae bacterium]MBT6706192.1 hypothetical protein [Flavobacteriaceae bacterium]